MRATPEQREQRRTERWQNRTGRGLGYLSPEAYHLLSRRLRARRRAKWICSPVYVAAVVIVVSSVWPHRDYGNPEWERRFVLRYLVAAALVTVGLLLAAELRRRAEQRIAGTVPRQVTRPERVPPWWMLGGVRSVFAVVAVLVEATLAVALVRVHPGRLAGEYAIGLGSACALAALGILRAARRSTLAVDDVSLAIDERLRSEDAFAATGMLYLLAITLPVSTVLQSDTIPLWLGDIWLLSSVVIQGLWFWASATPPWKTTTILKSSWS
jgi:hypothetical protein